VKDRDLRRFLGLTWAGWLNCLLLQWLCLRIVRHVEDDGEITRWCLIYGPIWRVGWSLPRRQAPPTARRPVTPVTRARVWLKVIEPVQPGDAVSITPEGDVQMSRVERNEAIGTFISTAPAGGVALVEVGRDEEQDA
jgi:hypothetical protein